MHKALSKISQDAHEFAEWLCTTHKWWKVYFIMLLDEEKNGGEFVNISYARLDSIVFNSKLQQHIKNH